MSLHGRVLQAVTATWKPFVSSLDRISGGDRDLVRMRGLYPDILSILEQRLNFSLEVTNPTDSWDTMVQLVGNKSVDMATTGEMKEEKEYLGFCLIDPVIMPYFPRLFSD